MTTDNPLLQDWSAPHGLPRLAFAVPLQEENVCKPAMESLAALGVSLLTTES